MARKIIVGSGILIGVYLIIANATNFGKAISSAGSAASGYVKTLQGR